MEPRDEIEDELSNLLQTLSYAERAAQTTMRQSIRITSKIRDLLQKLEDNEEKPQHTYRDEENAD